MDIQEDQVLPEILTLDDVAKVLKTTKNTVRRYTQRADYPLKKFYLSPDSKKSPRILKKDLLEFLESMPDPRQEV